MSALFSLQTVGMRYDGVPVLREVSLEFPAGQMVAVVGPNGAGKSTLLSIMAGLREGYEGQCRYRGRQVREWPRRAFARDVSFVPQSVRLEFPFSAEQVVLMGRTPYSDGLFESPEDHSAVEEALRLTDAREFRRRDFRRLSGGEKQRVVLASAIAQKPRVMLLDEPTTFLDLEHQVTIYRLLRELSGQGLLVVAATHDLNLASAYSDRIVALRNGRVVADAPPTDVFVPGLIREVFSVDTRIIPGDDGRPRIVYGD